MTAEELVELNELAQVLHAELAYAYALWAKERRLIVKALDELARLQVEVEVLRKGLEDSERDLRECRRGRDSIDL